MTPRDDEETFRSALTLAGFRITHTWKLVNCYDRDRKDPWYLFMTEIGPVKIGWRRRVIEADWEAASFGHMPVRCKVTEDNVTNTDTFVHAYSNLKLVEYLTNLHREAFKPYQLKG